MYFLVSEGSLITSLEGEGQGELMTSQMPEEPQKEGCVLQTPATRKALAGEPRAALLAPSEGAAPANTSWARVRKEGEAAAFWVPESQDLLTVRNLKNLFL